RVRLQFTRELANQGRFAGAVRSDYGMDLAGRDGQRNIASRDEAAEAFGQTSGFEQCLSHRASAGPQRARKARFSRTARPGSGSVRARAATARSGATTLLRGPTR